MNSGTPESNVLLAFQDVTLKSGEAAFDLCLCPGDLALVEAGDDVQVSTVGDLALGIRSPLQGDVIYQGKTWTKRSSTEAEQLRRRVGRVYSQEEGAAWLENLDLDENIQLAQRFDSEQCGEELVARALRVAGQFGLEKLPSMRPSVARRRTSMLAQWIRAFLPEPLNLLVLERPTRGADPEDVTLLLAAVEAVREKGTGVIWLEEESDLLLEAGLEPTWHSADFPPGLVAER